MVSTPTVYSEMNKILKFPNKSQGIDNYLIQAGSFLLRVRRVLLYGILSGTIEKLLFLLFSLK